LLSYDNVANEQRKVIYAQRSALLDLNDLSHSIDEMGERVIRRLVNTYIPLQSYEDQWQVSGLEQVFKDEFFMSLNIQQMIDEDHHLSAEDLQEKIAKIVVEHIQSQRQQVGEPWSRMSKALILETLDLYWREHLAALDYLRQGIHLRGYAQKDPKQEYKKESFHLFSRMLNLLEDEIISKLLSLHWQADEQIAVNESLSDLLPANAANTFEEPIRIGRNQVCYCGSGEKYKNCHGRLV
jgi:preprotein translocase subunit SecA